MSVKFSSIFKKGSGSDFKFLIADCGLRIEGRTRRGNRGSRSRRNLCGMKRTRMKRICADLIYFSSAKHLWRGWEMVGRVAPEGGGGQRRRAAWSGG
jgi:hypothetical protein